MLNSPDVDEVKTGRGGARGGGLTEAGRECSAAAEFGSVETCGVDFAEDPVGGWQGGLWVLV